MELFKNEAIRCGSPFRTGGLERLSDVEEVAFDGGLLIQQRAPAFVPR